MCSCFIVIITIKLVVDTTFYDATYLQNFETTKLSTKGTSSEKSLDTFSWPYTVLYMTSSFIGILAILCCLFVSIYFYKHCVRQINVTGVKENEHSPSAHYSTLGGIINHQNEHPGHTTYLEPVSSYVSHYNQIIDPIEKDDSSRPLTSATNETQTKSPSYETNMFLHSKSFPFTPTANDCKTGQPVRKLHFSNSL